MPLTAAISHDGPVHQLALGVERPHIGLLPVGRLAHSPVGRRAAHFVWARAAPRLEAHCGEAGAHFVGAFHLDEHDPADAEIQLARDVVGCLRRVGGDLRRLHHQRMRQSQRGGSGQRAGVGGGLDEIGDRPDGAIDAPFHRAIEQEVSAAVGERLVRQLARCFRRRRWGRRRAGAAASRRVARPVHTEHRLLLLEEFDRRVQPRALRVHERQRHSGNRDGRQESKGVSPHRGIISTRRGASPARRRRRRARRRHRARRTRS